MAREAFLPLFFGDFLASTAEWSGEEAALYLLLLGYQWTLGSVPADPVKVARLVRWERKSFEQAWPQVAEKFEENGAGRLINPRLEEHRAKSQKLASANAAKGRKGAQTRWQADSCGHESVNGQPIAAAINQPQPTTKPTDDTGIAAAEIRYSNPSHPIPSHPIPSQNSPESSSEKTTLTAGAEAPPGAESAGKRPRKMAPEDWQPSPRIVERIAEERIDAALAKGGTSVELELERFRACTFSTARTDWDKTWWGWLLREVKHAHQREVSRGAR